MCVYMCVFVYACVYVCVYVCVCVLVPVHVPIHSMLLWGCVRVATSPCPSPPRRPGAWTQTSCMSAMSRGCWRTRGPLPPPTSTPSPQTPPPPPICRTNWRLSSRKVHQRVLFLFGVFSFIRCLESYHCHIIVV